MNATTASHKSGRSALPVFSLLLILILLLISLPPLLSAQAENSATRPGVDFVYVCQDAGAGGYEAFPDVCRLQDGRLMAVFYAGYGHVSLPNEKLPRGGRISYCLSRDEGRTWTAAGTLYDGPDDDRDPSIVQLRDGRLICNFFSLRKKAVASDKEVPYEGLGTWMVESADLGKTWSEPRPISRDYYCSSPVRELPDGRLILGLYKEDRSTGVSSGAVVISRDGGKSWGPVVDIDNGGFRLDAETDVIPLKDGRLYAIQREPKTTMCYSISEDGGRSWSVSKPVGFPGHCPYLLRTNDDIIVLAHRLPQTSLHFSLDDCLTWSENVLVDDFIGAYPSMVNLKDGSVLIVYYEEGEGSSIRVRRFRASKSGIQWLSVYDGTPVEGVVLQPGWGAPDVRVAEAGGKWGIAGRQNTLTLDPATLEMKISSGSHAWVMNPSYDGDLVIKQGAAIIPLKLAGAGRKIISPYRTGFRTGVKIDLSDYRAANTPLDLRIQLFIGLEGRDEDLVCEILATDGEARVRECSWPAGLAAGSFDVSIVPFMQGMYLPKDWGKKVTLYDPLCYGRGLYMPWWGHQQGEAAALFLIETPPDAGVRFDHPAGGPTRVEMRWLNSLGRWAYPRRVRVCFLDKGDYVALAKRYRRHVMETGTFVSLAEKIRRNPLVGGLIGSPVVHTSILYHIQPGSSYYHKDDPAKNHELVTFDARAAQLRRLAGLGVNRAYVHLDGWGFRGYDNLHPDILPPCPEAGGWEGMRRFGDACAALDYIFAIHDQYRDYYLDAASYNPRHALLDENGGYGFHSTWYGGPQAFLCPSLAPGHVQKNHRALLDHGVKICGAYLDVFAVVPPDECYSPEHPVTRAECLAYRGDCLDFVRSWGGVASSEEPADWAIPHIDLVHHGPHALDPNPGGGEAIGIPIPLFNLVYHDALFLPWSLGKGAWGIPEKDLGYLYGLGNAGLPYLSIEPGADELEKVRTMCELHKRLALSELTGHRFIDGSFRRQEFSYADGTKIAIDLDASTFGITPALTVPKEIK